MRQHQQLSEAASVYFAMGAAVDAGLLFQLIDGLVLLVLSRVSCCRCEVVNNELELFDPEEGEQPPPAAASKLPQDFAVVVDAANTPQRLAQVLDDLREAGAKRIFCVFGCDGQVRRHNSAWNH
jgi:hypothetical protein